MSCDVVNECLRLRSQRCIRDDLINEAHEDLGRVSISERDSSVLEKTKGADEGGLECCFSGKGDLPKT
jgi:hypothetical protein